MTQSQVPQNPFYMIQSQVPQCPFYHDIVTSTTRSLLSWHCHQYHQVPFTSHSHRYQWIPCALGPFYMGHHAPFTWQLHVPPGALFLETVTPSPLHTIQVATGPFYHDKIKKINRFLLLWHDHKYQQVPFTVTQSQISTGPFYCDTITNIKVPFTVKQSRVSTGPFYCDTITSTNMSLLLWHNHKYQQIIFPMI